MTLYEFNRLTEEEQISTVWNKGVFLDNHILKTETLNCYAIDMDLLNMFMMSTKIKLLK